MLPEFQKNNMIDDKDFYRSALWKDLPEWAQGAEDEIYPIQSFTKVYLVQRNLNNQMDSTAHSTGVENIVNHLLLACCIHEKWKYNA